MVEWLRLCTFSAGGQGLILGQRTRSCKQQLRPGAVKYIYIYIYFFFIKVIPIKLILKNQRGTENFLSNAYIACLNCDIIGVCIYMCV